MNDPDERGLSAAVQQILNSGGPGTMATQSVKHPGFPYASVTPFAVDEAGRPVFLFSSMATHTRNLKQDSRAALLVTRDATGDLAAGRVTVMGTVDPLPDSETESARELYLRRHPESQQWLSFGDFAFYRMEIVDIYVVAGFGAMGWVGPQDYQGQDVTNDQRWIGNVTHPVGQLKPNDFGLFDMYGNVMEWCWEPFQQTYPDSADGPIDDPPSLKNSGVHTIRSGHFDEASHYHYSARRTGLRKENRYQIAGFRIARTLKRVGSDEDED